MPVTLAIDAWSTLTNKLVLGVCFLCQGTPYLITTLSNTGESQTAEYLENTFREHIELIEAELNVKITSVVTSQHGIDETQISRRSTYGCHAHMANLLSKDILQENEMKVPKIWADSRFHVKPDGTVMSILLIIA